MTACMASLSWPGGGVQAAGLASACRDETTGHEKIGGRFSRHAAHTTFVRAGYRWTTPWGVAAKPPIPALLCDRSRPSRYAGTMRVLGFMLDYPRVFFWFVL